MMLLISKFVIEFIFLGISIIFILLLCKTTPKSKPKSAAALSSKNSVKSDAEIKKSGKQQPKKKKKSDAQSSTPQQQPEALAASAPSAVAAFQRATKQYEDTKPTSEKSKKSGGKSIRGTKEEISTRSTKREASPDISEEDDYNEKSEIFSMSEEHDLNPIVSSKEEKADGNNNNNND